jgi:hypothetical protein
VSASPHIDVVGEGVLAGQMDRRSLLQLVMAATCNMDGEVRVGHMLLYEAAVKGYLACMLWFWPHFVGAFGSQQRM